MKDKCLACNGTGKFTERQSPREYLMAYWRWLKHATHIPEGAKSLALYLIKMSNNTTAEIAGNLELSYRRGIQDGEERAKPQGERSSLKLLPEARCINK